MLTLTLRIRANSAAPLATARCGSCWRACSPNRSWSVWVIAGMMVMPPTSKHVVEVLDALLPRGGDRPLGDLHGALEQLGGDLFQLLTGQLELGDAAVEPHVVLARQGGAERLLELLGRCREVLHELLVAAGIEVRVLVGEAAQQEVDDPGIPVGPAQLVVAVGADDGDVVALEADHRGVERPAAEVVDEDVPHAGVLPERLILQRGGHRLGEDVEHVQPGDLPGLAGGVALQHAEVGRHGDDHVTDLLAGLLLRGARQLAQDQRGDRLGRVRLPVEGVVHVLAHLPLDQLGDQVRGEHGGVLGLPADHHVLGRFEVDDRRRRVLSHRALQHHRAARVVHVSDAGVRRAEVDAVGCHVTSL